MRASSFHCFLEQASVTRVWRRTSPGHSLRGKISRGKIKAALGLVPGAVPSFRKEVALRRSAGAIPSDFRSGRTRVTKIETAVRLCARTVPVLASLLGAVWPYLSFSEAFVATIKEFLM